MECLQVKMLGTFSLSYGGKAISLERNITTKTNQLIQMILHAGENGIQRELLLHWLFENEEIANISNSFRGVMFRLRKLLKEQGLPENNYIVNKNGVYYWTADIPYECDCHTFEKKANEALQRNDRDKCKLLQAAVEAYGGEFLPMLGATEWVVVLNTKYKNLYSACVEQLCSEYRKNSEYQKLYDVAARAAALYPLEEWQAFQMEALVSLKKSKEAVQLYKETETMLFEELGVAPSKSMMEQMARIGRMVDNEISTITNVQVNLEESKEQEGAYYCAYPSFIENYRFMKRVLQRSGQSAWLLMCTITDGKGKEQESVTRLKNMSCDLEQAIRNSIRSGDMFTKYNASQYLILLIGIQQEDCELVINRINSRLEKKSRKDYVKYHKATVNQVEEKQGKIFFKQNGNLWEEKEDDSK